MWPKSRAIHSLWLCYSSLIITVTKRERFFFTYFLSEFQSQSIWKCLHSLAFTSDGSAKDWRILPYNLASFCFKKTSLYEKKTKFEKKRLINVQGVDLRLWLLKQNCSCILILISLLYLNIRVYCMQAQCWTMVSIEKTHTY